MSPQKRGLTKVFPLCDRCMLYQLVYGAPPFHSLNLTQKIRAITNPKHQISYPSTGAAVQDPTLVAIMKHCLQYNPKLRPPIEGLNGLLVQRREQPNAFTLSTLSAEGTRQSASVAQQQLMKESLKILLRDVSKLTPAQLTVCSKFGDDSIAKLMRTLVKHSARKSSSTHADNVLLEACGVEIAEELRKSVAPPAAPPMPKMNGGLLAAIGGGAAKLKGKRRKKKPARKLKSPVKTSKASRAGVGGGINLSDILAVKDGLKKNARRRGSTKSKGRQKQSKPQKKEAPSPWAISTAMRNRRQALGDLSPATQTIHEDSFEW